MTEKKIAQQNHFELSEYQETSKQSYQRKPYKKPLLQSLNTSADMIAGGSTSNQIENSSGLIGS
jgi:hypothetical protein